MQRSTSVEVEVKPVEVTVYGGKEIIDNGIKKEGSRRKEWGKFQTTVIRREDKWGNTIGTERRGMGARNNNSENIVRECVQGREHSIGVTAEDDEKAQERRAGGIRGEGDGKTSVGNECCADIRRRSDPSMGPITSATLDDSWNAMQGVICDDEDENGWWCVTRENELLRSQFQKWAATGRMAQWRYEYGGVGSRINSERVVAVAANWREGQKGAEGAGA
jgi:hypothetical protein